MINLDKPNRSKGGSGLFKWENIRNDRFAACYLGASVKAPVGKWQRGKDLEWYKKTKDEGQGNIKNEIDEIKRLEELAMAEALGIKPTQVVAKKESTSKEEFNVHISKDSSHKSHKRKHKRSTSADSHSSRHRKRHTKDSKDEKYKNKYY